MCRDMPKKPFTAWLVLLMIVLGPLTLIQAGRALAQLDQVYQPLTADHPLLSRAMLVFQILAVSCICVSLYTASVIYNRKAGTLRIIQLGIVVRAILLVLSSVSIPWLSGLPPETWNYKEIIASGAGAAVAALIWNLYLVRSVRVKELFSTQL